MILNDNIKVNKEFYRQKRSISSKIGNEFEQSIKNSKSIKSRHRKTESFYFLGSYISGDGLDKIINFYKAEFDDNLQNNNKDFHNEQINQKNLNNKITSNKINNYLNGKEDIIYDLNKNNKNADKEIIEDNVSLHSFSVEKNNEQNENQEQGNILIKEEINNDEPPNTNNNFRNNIFYELEKNNEKNNKNKSYIPLKNILKFIKDKEERVTESYLMALNGGEDNKKNTKNQYLPTASIIEEEKSEFVESTSKRQTIKIINDLNLRKEKMNKEFENIQNFDENKENINNYNGGLKPDKKYEFELNRIKINIFLKQEEKRKFLRKNKENLLNSFYNLSCNKSLTSSQNNPKINYINKNINNHFDINNLIINNINGKILTNNNNNQNNLADDKKGTLDKTSNKYLAKFPSEKEQFKGNKRTFSYSGGYISYLYKQRFNTENNVSQRKPRLQHSISKYIQKNNNSNNNLYKIYNFNRKKLKEKDNNSKKKLNKSLYNPIITKIKQNGKKKIPHKKFDNVYLSKLALENSLKNKDKRMNIELSHRRTVSKENIKKNISHRKSISTFTNFENSLNNKEMSNIDSTNLNTLIKKNTSKLANRLTENSTKINSRKLSSESKINVSKERSTDKIIIIKQKKSIKNKKYIKKKINSILRLKISSDLENFSEYNLNISNKNQTFIILNKKIKFMTSSEKIGALESLRNSQNENKNSFIILCIKQDINKDIFIFVGLYKYDIDKKKFNRIYGNDNAPNFFSIKNINSSNYMIYENKIIQTEPNKIQFIFNIIDSFYFSFNSIIICKKLFK